MSKANLFLKKTLGEDFFQSLSKVELWKPGTKSTLDHEEIRTALQIVPRAVIAFLIKELSPMEIGDTKEVAIPVSNDALLRVTKHERDVFSGEIEENSKKVVEFKLRSLPGIGLVIMSAFELYDMDNLINSENEEEPKAELADNAEAKIQSLIDERLALHDLIGKVVDKKIMEKEAINQLVLAKLTEAVKMVNEKASMAVAHAKIANVHAGVARQMSKQAIVATKKKKPLESFLENRKKNKEFSVVMAKGELFQCPDCLKNIFDGSTYSGCICMGDDRNKKLFIKKSEEGVKIRFGKGWDEENIELLFEVLQRKNG